MNAGVTTLGWRERAALPRLGIDALRAKLDTGARSSALHVDAVEVFVRHEATWLRFSADLGPRVGGILCEAPALGRRVVMDTGGGRSEVRLAGQGFEVEIGLVDRRHMRFPLLLGRTALFGRFRVDPALSYTWRPYTPAIMDMP